MADVCVTPARRGPALHHFYRLNRTRPRARGLDALALMRRGYSKRRSAALARTDPRTLDRYVAQALRKVGGRWQPTPYDRVEYNRQDVRVTWALYGALIEE